MEGCFSFFGQFDDGVVARASQLSLRDHVVEILSPTCVPNSLHCRRLVQLRKNAAARETYISTSNDPIWSLWAICKISAHAEWDAHHTSRTLPPIRLRASMIVTWNECSSKTVAQRRPETPAPIMHTWGAMTQALLRDRDVGLVVEEVRESGLWLRPLV